MQLTDRKRHFYTDTKIRGGGGVFFFEWRGNVLQAQVLIFGPKCCIKQLFNNFAPALEMMHAAFTFIYTTGYSIMLKIKNYRDSYTNYITIIYMAKNLKVWSNVHDLIYILFQKMGEM